MTANKLQEAITLIRAGDRQNGQRLLTEILNTDPGNETAWLWMSALMSGDKRRFCLEKVLTINPNHQQAREQLAKMASAAAPVLTIPTTVSVQRLTPSMPPEPVDLQPEPQPEQAPVVSYEPVQGMPLPKVWLAPGKYLSSVFYLEGNNVIVFDVSPDKGSAVFEELRLGVTQKQFGEIKDKFNLMNIGHLLLPKINSVTLFGDSLKIVGTDKSGNEKSIRATVTKENSEVVLKALHERLGPAFQKSIRPISRSRVMIYGLAVFLFTSCGTGFFYWFVQGLKRDIEASGGMTGSARAKSYAALLLLIGPNGFLCIGGVLLIIVIVFLISALRKPPEETVLARETE